MSQKNQFLAIKIPKLKKKFGKKMATESLKIWFFDIFSVNNLETKFHDRQKILTL